MSDITLSATVTVANPQGLHMRPAYLFAETAARFLSRIEVVKDDIRIDGKSVLSILTLGAAQGTEVAVEATGPDAQDALTALISLIASGFPGETDGGRPESGRPATEGPATERMGRDGNQLNGGDMRTGELGRTELERGDFGRGVVGS